MTSEKNPFIDEIKKLELEYLNLKAEEIQNEFESQDLTRFKSKEEVAKEYIAFLKMEIGKQTEAMQKKPRRKRKAKKIAILPDPKFLALD